ncbi:hypothetical protein ACFL27_25310 [candidate division CSSED10-310 bacterium]|uniref:Integrase catalytic domain-containing protein n=1 Tax=candidate division CSSED10-310 bacterium TaxID=2855610 RepID=A0ABV6Z4Z7_UNCC1
MNQSDTTITKPPSSEAVFRFLLVSQVLSRVVGGLSRSEAIRQVLKNDQFTLEGTIKSVSGRTLHRWVMSYLAEGLAGLEPYHRPSTGTVAFSQHLLTFFIEEKQTKPPPSIPELIRRARRKGLLSEKDKIDWTTVYRALKREGVDVKRHRHSPDDDQRRFAYEHRMQMMLCDGKHFKAGITRQKRVAFFYLDDATRFGLEVMVGTSETPLLFLQGLYKVICQYGIPQLMYLDHGPGFRANDSIVVADQVGSTLLLGRSSYPEGHGKIERFNQTALNSVLRNLDRRPDVDPHCEALRLRLRHWLTKDYNVRPHEALGQDTPFNRFHNDTKALEFPSNEQELDSQFMITEMRTVSKDNIVSMDSVEYEMPKGYRRKRVILYRNVLDESIHFQHKDRLIQLFEVDKGLNARTKRGKMAIDDEEEPAHPPAPTAADMAFEHDHSALVDDEGSFHKERLAHNNPSKEE